MKKILIICLAAAMTSCGIYKNYSRPEIQTDGLYGTAETADSTTIGDISWQEMFSDPYLRTIIARALENNTDLQSAQWRVKEAEATLKSARLAYLPSFNFAPQGSISSFDNAPASKTYSIPVTASWQIDIFGGLTNAKRRAKALYLQSREYEQATKTQLIASVANLYYTLLMLDSQYEVTEETAAKWRQSVEAMRALKEAGYANEAGVAQYEANTLADEYFRDLDKGLPIQLPYHYFPDDDPAKKPIRTWRSHGYLFYSNWLNYFVYQTTPYDISTIK